MSRLTKCKECCGTGYVEWIGGHGRPCDACGGAGEFNMSKRIRDAQTTADKSGSLV